jgi:hypothetical protein
MLCFNFMGFNHSIWHALWVLALPCTGVYFCAFFSLKKGHFYFFDPKHNVDVKLQKEGGEFEPHSNRFNDLAKLLIALSAGVIAFLVNTLANEKEPPSRILIAIESTAPIVVGFFGASMAFLILFMSLQAVWYEQYCHSPSHSTYVRWKYAVCTSLGWTGLLAFAIGITWFAQNLF